ncbi:MAG: hypothetical protein COS39_03935 [Hydrogenophilales bacterium CG03_land_8_20_14_0_80_62_28]|nr:hypothetical protein [Betaproteobacteria bacterium]OIO76987.1 MAG: hypothetical protein AUJ86_10070 [Hydrogenophilaceae bacterium CG1_02_62_390]PIV23570.1 MAG: hypothetical protein COS39_03935 [Hydrogenophilales bacterium CG03_land_8_20_14_0_80_62_28]PIW39163.1 MAG: hypothetical protein COW23_02725 [Hydrogenophilales bacterium CG15_BIG_FIL_POST_REV_8_21_14_020_62_31]PIW71794.1 MAG: hypothetical protein COW07_06370 [Hydrogenophilales bacterium CG12_big_fil_rev_8_21_14_0_65_61_21]PIX02583.1 M
MTIKKHSTRFWAGNAVLAFAAAVLFFMGPLSDWMGLWAMAIWIGLAAFGFYLVTADKGPDANDLD